MDVFDQKIQDIKAMAMSVIPILFSEEKLRQMAQVLREQYDLGEGGEGRIEPPGGYYPYTTDYVRKRNKKGLPSDRVMLYFDGDLYKSLVLTMGSEGVDIKFEGYDEVVLEWLEGFYGESAFSPNEDSLERMRSIMLT